MGLTNGSNIGSGGVDQGIDSFNRQYQQDSETNRNIQGNILALEKQKTDNANLFGSAIGTAQEAIAKAREAGDKEAEMRAKQSVSDLQEQYRTRMANLDQTRGSLEGGIIGGDYKVISTPVIDTRVKMDQNGQPMLDSDGQPIKETYTKNVQTLRKTFGNNVQDTANAATVHDFLNLPENADKNAAQVYNNSVLKQAYTPVTYNPNKMTTGAFTPEIAKGNGWEVQGLPNGGQKVVPIEKIMVAPPKYATDEAMLNAQREEALRKAGLELEDSDKSKAELNARYNYGEAQKASIAANNAQGTVDPMFMTNRNMPFILTANGEQVKNPWYKKSAEFIPELGGQGITTSRQFKSRGVLENPSSGDIEQIRSLLITKRAGGYDADGKPVESENDKYIASLPGLEKEYKKANTDLTNAIQYNTAMANLKPGQINIANHVIPGFSNMPKTIDTTPIKERYLEAQARLYDPKRIPNGVALDNQGNSQKDIESLSGKWSSAYEALRKGDSTHGGSLQHTPTAANGAPILQEGQPVPEAVPMPKYVSARQAEINTENQYNDTRAKMLAGMEKQMVDKYVSEKLKGMKPEDKAKDPNYIPQQIDPSTGTVIAPESYKLPEGSNYKAMAEQQLQEALKGDKKKMSPELQALKNLEEQVGNIDESYKNKATRADINSFYDPSKYKNYSMY